MSDPKTFYEETFPQQWNQTLREQERAVEAATRTLEGMRAVEATIRVQVGPDTFHLNISAGRLSPAETAAHEPFLTLAQDVPDFERLVAEAGGSALGFLGALSGLGEAIKLTRNRIEGLASLDGSMQFSVTGDAGFSLRAHFGGSPVPDEPTATIEVSREAYDQLKAGELNPQDALLEGTLQVDGDMQLAMQVALAVMSPD